MAKLSFIDALDKSQLEYAEKIGLAAKAAGVPPDLAIAIGYQESKLNPNAKVGGKGEIGIMQVMPATGKMLGSSENDLRDPDKNIATGIKYLKQALDATNGDRKLATVGYNAGIDAKFFSGGELPESTKNYVKSIASFGAFAAKPEKDTDMVAADAPPVVPPTADISGASEGERFLGGLGGTAAGVASIAGQAGIKGISDAMMNRSVKRTGLEEAAKIAAQRSAVPVVPAGLPAPTAVAPPGGLTATVGGQPAQSIRFGVDAGRMAPGQTGVMPYNYGKAAGLTDIEAGRARDMTKQPGGVHDLSTQRREGLNRVQQIAPGFKENPNFGGLMTQDASVGGGPRASFVPQPAIPPSPELPAGQAAGMRQLPPAQPVSAIPPPVATKASTGLEAVTKLFRGMMDSPVGKFATKVGGPLLGGLSAGIDAAELAHEYDKPQEQRDYIKMALKGAGALGGALSMFPPTLPIGATMAGSAAAISAARDPENQAWMRQKMQQAMSTDMPYSNPMGN